MQVKNNLHSVQRWREYWGRYRTSWAFDFFVGILSGWSLDGDGGVGLVDPGEELGIIEIRGESPLFQIYPALYVDFGDAVFTGMFLEGKCNGAYYEVCDEDADAELTLHGLGSVV